MNFKIIFFADRASESLNQLKHALDEKDLATGENAAIFEQLFPNTTHEESEDRAWKELQYSHAGLKHAAFGFVLVRVDFAA